MSNHDKPKNSSLNLNGASAPKSSSPIKFPCDFTVKVIGHNEEDFQKHVSEIIKKHFPNHNANLVTTRPSKDNNYLALTITVYAHSKNELDALYQELTDCQHVLIAL